MAKLTLKKVAKMYPDLDYVQEIAFREKTNYEVVVDVYGTLRWKADPLIDEMFNRGYIDLNNIFSGQVKPAVGLQGPNRCYSVLKNDPMIRELYRRLGYSLFGYWEVFHWDANNPDCDDYVEEGDVDVFKF